MSGIGTCGIVLSLPMLYLAYEAVNEGDDHADRGVLSAYSLLAAFVATLATGITLTVKNAPQPRDEER